MILILDNAPYHCCEGPQGLIKISTATRKQLVDWLVSQATKAHVETVSWTRILCSILFNKNNPLLY